MVVDAWPAPVWDFVFDVAANNRANPRRLEKEHETANSVAFLLEGAGERKQKGPFSGKIRHGR